ncbi:MAG: TSCPD domain-containing protein [Treponema sp.]|nr:TSCPD domain-containing protein [Treponema sp.]MCQ2600645.1 TSCPD domain-containing protein [Treponema sp.]
MTKTYKTKDTCATQITFDKAEDGTITNISFTGGCNGKVEFFTC